MRGWIKDTVYHKNEKESGKLRIGGASWSINLEEIKGLPITSIEYHTSEADYKISYDDAHAKGFVRVFRGEPKLIVPLKAWNIKSKVVEQPKKEEPNHEASINYTKDKPPQMQMLMRQDNKQSRNVRRSE